MKTILRGKPLAVRFWASVDVAPPDACWLWRGHVDPDGYGRISAGSVENVLAHRLSWEFANRRDFPADMVAMHSCDNRRCVNPGHVCPGTIAENTKDAVRKRRHVFGARSSRARLSDEKVEEIVRRRRAGETAVALAKEFGVSNSLICRVANGKRWVHVFAAGFGGAA